MSTLELTKEAWIAVQEFILEICGVYLEQDKCYVIERRLGDLCLELGLTSYEELIQLGKKSESVNEKIVDAITNNETLFFRDEASFKAFQYKALPELIDSKANTAGAKRLRIWSAACSTGQEVYSIAMALHEVIFDIENWDIEILGTDVSPGALNQAIAGEYGNHEVERGLSNQHLIRFFKQTPQGYEVDEKLRRVCKFKLRDLTKPLIGMGPFDIVYCRNVAIYFKPEDRRKLFERIQRAMLPQGYLFVGASETLTDLDLEPHHHCNATFYRPNLS